MSRVLLVAAVLVAVGILTYEPLLQALGDYLAAADPLAPADAVIAISGDGRERVRTAAEVFLQGHARWVILSGGPPMRRSGSARELARFAREYGVPEARILLDEAAASTVENARGSAEIMRAHGLRRAILVTSPYHMRRSIIIFRATFRPAGLTVRAYPARDSFLDLQGWWKRRQTRKFVTSEYVKLLAFLVGIR